MDGCQLEQALSCSAHREPWWLSWQSGLFSLHTQKVVMWQCCSCCMVWEHGCAATGKWVPGEQGGIGQQWPGTCHAQGAQVLCGECLRY